MPPEDGRHPFDHAMRRAAVDGNGPKAADQPPEHGPVRRRLLDKETDPPFTRHANRGHADEADEHIPVGCVRCNDQNEFRRLGQAGVHLPAHQPKQKPGESLQAAPATLFRNPIAGNSRLRFEGKIFGDGPGSLNVSSHRLRLPPRTSSIIPYGLLSRSRKSLRGASGSHAGFRM